jgi:YD repeat-containing protein
VTLAYEPPGALNQLTDRKTLVLGYTLSRLAAGTVANATPCTNTITYSYDAADRLTQALDVLVGTNANFAFGVRCVASSPDD